MEPEQRGPLLSLSAFIRKANDKISELDGRVQALELSLAELQRSVVSKRAELYRAMEPTPAQLRILQFVDESPRGATIKEIRDDLRLAKATVSNGLKQLINMGAVQRIPSVTGGGRYRYVRSELMTPELKRMLDVMGSSQLSKSNRKSKSDRLSLDDVRE